MPGFRFSLEIAASMSLSKVPLQYAELGSNVHREPFANPFLTRTGIKPIGLFPRAKAIFARIFFILVCLFPTSTLKNSKDYLQIMELYFGTDSVPVGRNRPWEAVSEGSDSGPERVVVGEDDKRESHSLLRIESKKMPSRNSPKTHKDQDDMAIFFFVSADALLEKFASIPQLDMVDSLSCPERS